MNRPRLLLAEDHEMVGQGFKALLSPVYDIVGIVRDGAQVVTAVCQHHPDLLLLDLSMPNRAGLEILDELRSTHPGVRVLVVTMHADHIMMEAALELGALGFIPKDADGAELRGAIEEVLAGRRYVSVRIARQGHRGGSAECVGFLRLTPRQQEIVRLIARGMTSEQIAERLGVSGHTVHFHRKNIRRELGIHSDWEMHRYAILVELSSEAAAAGHSHP